MNCFIFLAYERLRAYLREGWGGCPNPAGSTNQQKGLPRGAFFVG
jgi:hypothetical protein